MDRHSQETTGIETLEEILRLLRIMKNYISNRNRITKLASKEILIIPILAVYNKMAQTAMLKSMIPDLEWFNSD